MKRDERCSSLPEGANSDALNKEPMWCFETAVKMLYWSFLCYDYEENKTKAAYSVDTALSLYDLHSFEMLWEPTMVRDGKGAGDGLACANERQIPPGITGVPVRGIGVPPLVCLPPLPSCVCFGISRKPPPLFHSRTPSVSWAGTTTPWSSPSGALPAWPMWPRTSR